MNKNRDDMVKKAVSLATHGQWHEAILINKSILAEFPSDLEACNRLGKALAEIGKIGEAKDMFKRALQVSPHNTIAEKNLGRLTQMDENVNRLQNNSSNTMHTRNFIEESGKASVTSLINLSPSKALMQIAPGHRLELMVDEDRLLVKTTSGTQLGQIEPKLASRLLRLINGGNKYVGTATSVGENELVIIIKETYQHPSQIGTQSFTLKSGNGYRSYLPLSPLGYELQEENSESRGKISIKDWSDDDTEPGDDDAFTPVVHRVVDANDPDMPTENEF